MDDDAYEERRRTYGAHIAGPGVYPRRYYEFRGPTDEEAAELAHERASEERWAAEGRIGEYRRIVELRTAAKIDGFLVDGWTAAACVAVHDRLNERNRQLWLDMPVQKQCWVAVSLATGSSR
ncbi:hypothetical protein ABT354_11125 [Streptomyces sp. NPDC000594]|uniref:hypothetical protein n=1 Tax=Streptomyces sp. NPDC000594 TaxID=3154261 RepID=UPI003332169E